MTIHDLSQASLGQISIRAVDLARATAFYRDRLGLKLLFEVPKMAFFDCAGVRLMLGIAEDPELEHASSILYFRVEQLAATHATLSERGVTFRTPPHLVAKLPDREIWMAFFEDGEGNTHALLSEPPVVNA